MQATTWKRKGSSIIWSRDLLGPLITDGSAVPLRTALSGWRTASRSTRLAALALFWSAAFKRSLKRPVQQRRPTIGFVRTSCRFCGRRRLIALVGFVFGMTGPRGLFHLNEGDDLVYFGRFNDRSENTRITLGIWNGAATGEGAYRLITTGSKKEVGGYHVSRIS